MDPILDKNFKNYKNKEDTQHQFIFKAVPVSEKFPNGVMMQYRAYCRDEVIEIQSGEGEGYLLGKF